MLNDDGFRGRPSNESLSREKLATPMPTAVATTDCSASIISDDTIWLSEEAFTNLASQSLAQYGFAG
jgi:hypothetical protein